MIANDRDLSGVTMRSSTLPTISPFSLYTLRPRICRLTLHPRATSLSSVTSTPTVVDPAICALTGVPKTVAKAAVVRVTNPARTEIFMSVLRLHPSKGTARQQCTDIARAEAEFLQNSLVVLSEGRGAPSRHLFDAMHLYWAADGGSQLAGGTFQWHNNVIERKLRIIDDFLRTAHGAERHVDALEDLLPMRHRLGCEDIIQNRRQLRHVRHLLRRIGEP